MGTSNRREILGRLAALVAGPLLLGRQALDVAFKAGKETPPEAPPAEAPARIALTPPTHSVKRRG